MRRPRLLLCVIGLQSCLESSSATTILGQQTSPQHLIMMVMEKLGPELMGQFFFSCILFGTVELQVKS